MGLEFDGVWLRCVDGCVLRGRLGEGLLWAMGWFQVAGCSWMGEKEWEEGSDRDESPARVATYTDLR